MKYPKIIKEERLKIPVFRKKDSSWVASFLNENGTIEESGFVGHHTKKSCWVVCKAYNDRVGYTHRRTKEILKELGYGKKIKKIKKEKRKKKKSKKNKS